MENDKIVKLAATIIVGSVLVPIVWNVGVLTVGGIAKIVTKANFNRKMKKGIKEGSIVEIDGQFYEIKVEDAERADAVFTKLMGEEVSLRKSFIQAGAKKIDLEELDI